MVLLQDSAKKLREDNKALMRTIKLLDLELVMTSEQEKASERARGRWLGIIGYRLIFYKTLGFGVR